MRTSGRAAPLALALALAAACAAPPAATGPGSPRPSERPAAAAATRPATPTAVATPAPTLGTPAPPARTPLPATCPATDSGRPATRAFIDLEKGGTIVVALQSDAPATVRNFANLARSHCYDGLTFHLVTPSTLIQGGDPAGDGTGGGQQPAEVNDLPFVAGTVAMARASGTRDNSQYQFFVCLVPLRGFDNVYTNFGHVVAGLDVAAGVRKGDRIKTIRIE